MNNQLKIGSGIVTYNPDINRLRENVKAIQIQVEELIIVDNGSGNVDTIVSLCEEQSVKLIQLNENKGIAYALNVICNYFYELGFQWTLTLDQDSVSPDNLIFELSKHISKNVGVVGPKIVYRNNEKYIKESTKEVEETDWIITSASLTNLNAWKKINGFDNKLFIDAVDKDLCIRMAKNDYRILVCNNVQLMHELGNLRCRKILGRTIYVTNHSAFRLYYMSRNAFYLDKKYRTSNATKYFLKLMIKVILFETEKCKKIKSLYQGFYDRNNID